MNGARRGKRLSVREREIVGAYCEGERYREIAERLCISPKTVSTHTENIKVKLGARTVAAACYQYALRYRSEI